MSFKTVSPGVTGWFSSQVGCSSQIAFGEGKVSQPKKLDFTLQELPTFSKAVKSLLPSWAVTPGARASMFLPGFHPEPVDTALHFGLRVGKALEMKTLN